MSLVPTLMTRLSSRFILLDFAYDRDIYTGKAASLGLINSDHIEIGKQFCGQLLDPLVDRYGPCSIAAGICADATPKALHGWTAEGGAAADVAFHDWTNEGGSPIELLDNFDRSGAASFDRLISYAGSEFMCIGTKFQGNRRALHENIRCPLCDNRDGKPALYATWGYGQNRKSWPYPERAEERKNWRRAKDEPVYHTMRSLRAQHIRVGRFFTMLDFCHNPYALNARRLHVPNVENDDLPGRAGEAVPIMRALAEVLEQATDDLGHLSIVRGLDPKALFEDAHADKHLYRPGMDLARVVIAMPHGEDTAAAVASIEGHSATADVTLRDIGDSLLVAVEVRPFKASFPWRSYATPGS